MLAVSVAACGGGQDKSQVVGDAGLDVCGLVSDDTVTELQDAAGEKAEPVEDLKTGAETFIECRITRGVALGFAVRAVPGEPSAESMVSGPYDSPAEPLEGFGDSAVIGSNSYDGVRIAVTVGDQELLVDSNFSDRADGTITRDEVIALAKEVSAELGTDKPGAIRLPQACPEPADAMLAKTVGTVVVARGSVADDGSTRCSYAGQDRRATLAAVNASTAMSTMALADSDPKDRTTVDGDQALFDDDQLAIFAGGSCVISASASPLGASLTDQRPEADRRADAVELARFVKKSIGCP